MKKMVIGAMAALAVGTGGGILAVSGHGGGTGGQSLTADTLSDVLPGAYAFRTVDDQADPTFNQLLGVNDAGTIAGYFGSGAQGHPNKGYRVVGGSFDGENFPASTQTQVTGLNDRGVTVGFFSTMNNANQVNDNVGFYAAGGSFHRVAFPATSNATPPVNQLLGVNDSGTAVGFYTDAAGNNHGYEYSIDRHRYQSVPVSGATSATAAAINGDGDVAGFFTGTSGATEGFVRTSRGITHLAYPGASMTQALGINDHDEVVGVYQVGSGSGAQTHGFTWTARQGYNTVDDPNGVGSTTVNGVNDAGVLAGFYVDGAGNTDGMLATPQRGVPSTRQLTLSPMPVGTVSFGRNGDGMLTVHVDAFGFTPGSQHTVEIDAPGRSGPVVRFGGLSADGTGRVDSVVTAVDSISALPPGSEFVIRLGVVGGDGNRNAVAAEPIARTGALIAHPSSRLVQLRAVDVTTGGSSAGLLSGHASVTFNAAAHTLSVTLSATGLTPGNHAAHIHVGSCESQGPVQYMLMDFRADSRGDVVAQTRVVSGVTSVPSSGWYLNLHQGDSNSILVNGQPALSFRPVLCANM